eukprot:4904785-Heterocapsa_arctica.AAC.1
MSIAGGICDGNINFGFLVKDDIEYPLPFPCALNQGQMIHEGLQAICSKVAGCSRATSMARLFHDTPLRDCNAMQSPPSARWFVDLGSVKTIGLSLKVVTTVQLLTPMEEDFIFPALASISLALFDKHDGGNKPFILLMLFRMLIRARRSHITKWDDWVWTRSGAGLRNLCFVP